MAKDFYKVERVDKNAAAGILLRYHYLKDISKGFKSGYNYGLFYKDKLVGVVIYTGFPVPELVKGMFGLERTDQKGMFELSRLCLEPTEQAKEHNLASFFVAKTIKMLREDTDVRCILSYADNNFHKGTVYRALGFDYYGLTAKKTDFWFEQKDGTFIKHSRGKIKGTAGEWRPRSQKHRFVKVYDSKLKMKWEK
jgi:hypothetical protein|tara:strand:- start:219 stop:803 length:585 start_codon:yes stop_codon:yes gene_type:complete